MARQALITLHESVTDTHCNKCVYVHPWYDEDPLCSQDIIIYNVICSLLPQQDGRNTQLLGDDGNRINVNLYNLDTDGYDPIPPIRRCQECIERFG